MNQPTVCDANSPRKNHIHMKIQDVELKRTLVSQGVDGFGPKHLDPHERVFITVVPNLRRWD